MNQYIIRLEDDNIVRNEILIVLSYAFVCIFLDVNWFNIWSHKSEEIFDPHLLLMLFTFSNWQIEILVFVNTLTRLPPKCFLMKIFPLNVYTIFDPNVFLQIKSFCFKLNKFDKGTLMILYVYRFEFYLTLSLHLILFVGPSQGF